MPRLARSILVAGLDCGPSRSCLWRKGKVLLNFFRELRLILCVWQKLDLLDERSTGVQRVPRGCRLRAVAAGSMDTEAVDDLIPDGSECVDDQRLAERNPDVFDEQIPNVKILDSEVFRLFNRAGMLPKSVEQLERRLRVRHQPTLPRSFGHGFSDVDGEIESALAILLSDYSVSGKVASVIDGIDSRALKSFPRRHSMDRLAEQRVAYALTKMDLVEWVERGRQPAIISEQSGAV